MYKITLRKELNPTVTMMEIEAPLVAKKAEPGQFIILRVNEDGERIPLTIAGCNPYRRAEARLHRRRRRGLRDRSAHCTEAA